MELVTSDQSASQRHIFFAERAAAKIGDMPKDVKPLEVKHAAVLGAGTMGGGIAMNLANAGIPTYIFEVSQELLDKGLAIVRGNYQRTAKKGRMTQEDVEKRMALIKPTLTAGGQTSLHEEHTVHPDTTPTLDRRFRPRPGPTHLLVLVTSSPG